IADKFHYAGEVIPRNLDWRRCIQIPVAVAVIRFGPGIFKLITQTDVEGQLTADLPVVLDEEPPVAGARESFRIDIEVRTIAPAQQHRGKSVALEIVAGVEILACRLSVEGEMAR